MKCEKEIAIQTSAHVKGKGFARVEAGETEKTLQETKAEWQRLAQPWEFRAPWPDMHAYLNGWALYQVLACRLLGRSSLYQSGGAYGFRDQLQDVCALLETALAFAREQILRACAHQYTEGDVQHWWHPTQHGDRGVRTRCSDDLLWLPYTVCRYIEATGDRMLLQEKVPYLSSAPLAADEQDRYEKPARTQVQEAVLAHCCRAADLVLHRGFGSHGLPFIGVGDWNDGYSCVGKQGKGESVWLAWFFSIVLRKLAPHCPADKAANYLYQAECLVQAAAACWDGDRFLRGYFDDGTPLGSCSSAEVAMDSLAQSFAVFADCPDREKLCVALRTLFWREKHIVTLLTPPFQGLGPDSGYIRNYPPGVRENGGQYTHGAVWLAMACFELGMRKEGIELLLALLPSAHDWKDYRVEPFVLAGDVYAHPQYPGRGGWSWYTGAAS